LGSVCGHLYLCGICDTEKRSENKELIYKERVELYDDKQSGLFVFVHVKY